MDANLALPKWTKRVVTTYTGRDPLGLSRVSQTITDYLLHGIITQTNRARYYSLYCWMLWHVEHHEQPRSYDHYKTALRRRETMIALASLLQNRETSIHGKIRVAPELDPGLERGQFDCDFKVLPSNEFGGYGQYYAGSIYQLGLTHRDETGIDHVTEGVAEELAHLVHAGLEATPYIRQSLYKQPRISAQELEKTAPRLSVDALTDSFAKQERQRLTKLFFGIEGSTDSLKATLRRQTLTLVLHVVEQLEKQGSCANLGDVDWCLAYPPYYYDALWLDEDSVAPFNCPQALEVVKNFWRQFCLHQFLSQALERLLFSVLEVAGTESAGLSLAAIVDNLITPAFHDYLETRIGHRATTPADLLNSFGVTAVPNGDESREARKHIGLKHSLSEASTLMDETPPTPEVELARAVLLLGVIYAKWRGEGSDPSYLEVQRRAGNELCAPLILPVIDGWLNREATWNETLPPLIETFVLDQHDRVMYEKRRLDSSWLRRVVGKVQKEQDYGPRYRSSRHHNCVTILADLGLLSVDSEGDIHSRGPGRTLAGRFIADPS